jgi:hypothetical protein
MDQPRPVQINRPILTIRVDIVEKQTMGPDLKIKIQALDGPQQTVGLGKHWLYHYPVDKDITEAEIKYSITEEDPVYPDVIPERVYTLAIDSSQLPSKSDEDNPPKDTVSLQAYEGTRYGYRTGEFELTFEYCLTVNIIDLLFYTQQEMAANKDSPEVTTIKILHAANGRLEALFPRVAPYLRGVPNLMNPALKAVPFVYWAYLVMPGGQWDHKPVLTGAPKIGPYCLDSEKGDWYYNDIWSNIHFGYIGKAAGFSRRELLIGAAIAQGTHDAFRDIVGKFADFEKLVDAARKGDFLEFIRIIIEDATDIINKLKELHDKVISQGVTSLDDPSDQATINIGSSLYDKYGNSIDTLDTVTFLREVRRRRSKLSPPDKTSCEGVPPKKFRKKDNQF